MVDLNLLLTSTPARIYIYQRGLILHNDQDSEDTDSPEITVELLLIAFNGENLKAIRSMMQLSFAFTKNNMINDLKAKLSNQFLVNYITSSLGPNQTVIDLALSKLNLDNPESKLQYVTELVEFAMAHYKDDNLGMHASLQSAAATNNKKPPSPSLESSKKKTKR